MVFEAQYDSPLGPLTLVSDGEALTGLRFGEAVHSASIPLWKDVYAWLDGYFAGESPALPPMKPRGTDFQKRVWQQLLTIPRGSTRTYGELARQLGMTAGAQAVGQAVGKNPIAILIPCHRVVGKAGLTGYAWGLARKEALLALEQK